MNTVQLQRTRCPKCGGRLFSDKDRYGYYQQCLQCGFIKNVEEAVQKPDAVIQNYSSSTPDLIASSSTR